MYTIHGIAFCSTYGVAIYTISILSKLYPVFNLYYTWYSLLSSIAIVYTINVIAICTMYSIATDTMYVIAPYMVQVLILYKVCLCITI